MRSYYKLQALVSSPLKEEWIDMLPPSFSDIKSAQAHIARAPKQYFPVRIIAITERVIEL